MPDTEIPTGFGVPLCPPVTTPDYPTSGGIITTPGGAWLAEPCCNCCNCCLCQLEQICLGITGDGASTDVLGGGSVAIISSQQYSESFSNFYSIKCARAAVVQFIGRTTIGGRLICYRTAISFAVWCGADNQIHMGLVRPNRTNLIASAAGCLQVVNFFDTTIADPPDINGGTFGDLVDLGQVTWQCDGADLPTALTGWSDGLTFTTDLNFTDPFTSIDHTITTGGTLQVGVGFSAENVFCPPDPGGMTSTFTDVIYEGVPISGAAGDADRVDLGELTSGGVCCEDLVAYPPPPVIPPTEPPTPSPPPDCTAGMPTIFNATMVGVGGFGAGCPGCLSVTGAFAWVPGGVPRTIFGFPAGPPLDGYLWNLGDVCGCFLTWYVFCDPDGSLTGTAGWHYAGLWCGAVVPGPGAFTILPSPTGWQFQNGQPSLALPCPGATLLVTATAP